MPISLDIQFGLIVFNLTAGVITGVLFDIYRVIRGFEHKNKVITFIEDTLFWILAAIIVFIFLIINNYAIIGIYAYLWIAVGLAIYFKAISKYWIKIQLKFTRSVGKILRVCKNLIIYPFQLMVYNIKSKKEKSDKNKYE